LSLQKLINQKIEPVKENPYPQTEKPMTEKEKKEWDKEKQRRKQEFFATKKQKPIRSNSFRFSKQKKYK
jgi:ATP-dependent RNA helicase RhlE